MKKTRNCPLNASNRIREAANQSPYPLVKARFFASAKWAALGRKISAPLSGQSVCGRAQEEQFRQYFQGVSRCLLASFSVSLIVFDRALDEYVALILSSNDQAGSASPCVVLIVDDEPDDVVFSKRTITRSNAKCTVHAVASGKELIAYLQGDSACSNRTIFPYPNLILLDLNMPVMDGFEVLAWLCANPPHSQVCVIVLSGAGEWRRMEKAYQLGARSFLTKPFNAADFMSTMKSFDILVV